MTGSSSSARLPLRAVGSTGGGVAVGVAGGGNGVAVAAGVGAPLGGGDASSAEESPHAAARVSKPASARSHGMRTDRS